MSTQRKGRAMDTGMDLAANRSETSDFYALGRLRARVAELEVEVNLLHRQRHAAQEDAANARLLAAVCHPAPDVVPAPASELHAGELEVLREGFGLMRTAYNTHALHDYQNVLAEQIIAKFDALRAGEAGKGGAT